MNIAARCVHGVGVCILPRAENDHRPLALRGKSLTTVSLFLLAVKLATLGIIGLTPRYAELSTITANRIVEFTNTERVQAGLSPLAVNSLLTNAAQQKAQHMLNEDYFAHISPSGVTPWFWMGKVGYTYQLAGENLAIDYTEAEDVVAAWLASPSHKANLLHAEYIETGVAVATGEFQGGTSTVVVHMFGNPTGQVASQSASAPAPTPSPSPKPATPASTPPPTPSPSPTIVPAPGDITPPRVPRIALIGETETIQQTVTLELEGEGGSTLAVLVNNQLRHTIPLPAEGKTTETLSLEDLPDGTITLRSYASDAAGNESELSSPLTLQKDTLGPQLDAQQLQFVVAPAFDTVTGALFVPAGEVTDTGWKLVDISQPLTLTLTDAAGNETTLTDVRLAPTFLPAFSAEVLERPALFQRVGRNLTMGIALALVLLLVLAIVIRIQIQHPRMIGHATVAIILAVALWLL